MLVFAYFSPTVTHTPLQFSSMEIKGELELQRITQARNWHTFNLCMVLVILRTEIWQETRRKGSCPRRERRGTWNEKYLTKRTRTETTAKKPPPSSFHLPQAPKQAAHAPVASHHQEIKRD